MKKFLVLALTSIALLTGCSTQNREAEPVLSDSELNSLISEMVSSSNSVLASLFPSDGQAAASGSVRVYHAGSMKGRPAASVLALTDIGVFDPTAGWEPYTWTKDTTLDDAQVLFVESTDADGQRTYTLAVKMHFSDEQDSIYFEASTPGSDAVVFDGDMFEAVLDSSNHRIIVRSDDISDEYSDELADSVKLYVFVEDAGGERYIGQISTMASYN